MFKSIIDSSAITFTGFLICAGVAVVCGVITALCYMYKNRYNKNFVMTLIILPIVVQSVIMMVNGNLGTGVAVVGAFSLVRFRSAPGNSRDIAAIFLAMAVGLATGMGQIFFAMLVTVVACAVMLALTMLNFGGSSDNVSELKITIPEDIDYEGVFDDILKEYTSSYTLDSTKTTNMGSLFELRYEVVMKDRASRKAMIDKLRTRNGNLAISLGRIKPNNAEL